MQHEKIELNKLHAQSKVTLISVQAVQGNIYIRSTHTHTLINTVMGSQRTQRGRVQSETQRDRSIKIN